MDILSLLAPFQPLDSSNADSKLERGDESICDIIRGTSADERIRHKLIYTDYLTPSEKTVSEDGTKGKVRILVGTDVTDNYIMIIGSSPKNFAANEKTIDLIWGSFEMWSGVS